MFVLVVKKPVILGLPAFFMAFTFVIKDSEQSMDLHLFQLVGFER